MSKKIEKLNSVSSISLKKHTKYDWSQWFSLIEKKMGSANLTQPQHFRMTIQYLKKNHKLSSWWLYIVARGYGILKGTIIEGQNLKGEYSTTSTKSLQVSSKTAWKFLTSDQGQSIWLNPMTPITFTKGAMFEVAGGIYGEVRTLASHRRIRLKWMNEDSPEHSFVQLHVIAKAKGKCLIAITHEKIRMKAEKEKYHAQWSQRLTLVKQEIEKDFK